MNTDVFVTERVEFTYDFNSTNINTKLQLDELPGLYMQSESTKAKATKDFCPPLNSLKDSFHTPPNWTCICKTVTINLWTYMLDTSTTTIMNKIYVTHIKTLRQVILVYSHQSRCGLGEERSHHFIELFIHFRICFHHNVHLGSEKFEDYKIESCYISLQGSIDANR